MDAQSKVVLDSLDGSVRSEEADNSTLHKQCKDESTEKSTEPPRDTQKFIHRMRSAKSINLKRQRILNRIECMKLAKALKSSSTEQIEPQIEPPEPWTPCRLRQRDRARSMLETVKEEDPWEHNEDMDATDEDGRQNVRDAGHTALLITVKEEEPWEQHEDMILKDEEGKNMDLDINGRTEIDEEKSREKQGGRTETKNKRNRNRHQEARMKRGAEERRSLKLQHSKIAWLKRVANETPEQRSARLECARNCMRTRRARMETPEQRSARLECARNCMRTRRARMETPEQRSARLECARNYMRARRARMGSVSSETPEQRSTRLECERRKRMSARRVRMETPEQRSARLECARNCMRARRARMGIVSSETPEQRSTRLECERRKRMSARRARMERVQNETEEQRSIRLERERNRMRARIQFETEEQRSLRLAHYKRYKIKRVANETPEQRSTRLEFARNRTRARLEFETEDQRSLRLERLKRYRIKRVANETSEQRSTMVTIRKIRKLRVDTEEQQNLRLERQRANRSERARMARLKRIASETEEGRLRRLASIRRGAERRKSKMRAVRQWISQQSYLACLLEKTIKDEEETPTNIADNSENDCGTATESSVAEISHFTPEIFLQSPTGNALTIRETHIKAEPEFNDDSSHLYFNGCFNDEIKQVFS